MRQARRLYSKIKTKSLHNQQSSVFRSKMMRDLPDESRRSSVGPGQYNISFPMVRPKIQAIRKNNNTIIVKVNDKQSPAFQSISPRFKQARQHKFIEYEENVAVQGKEGQPKERQNLQNRQIERGMKNRIKKLSDILSSEQDNYRKNLMMTINASNTDRLQKVNGGEQTINSLKLYKKQRQRLHFLLKQMKPSNNTKGVQWSKYRQTKGNLYQINNVPGPGTYREGQPNSTRNRYYETIDDKSWQFKSVTRRNYFEKGGQKEYELCPSRNRFISEIDGKFHKVESIPLIHDRSITKIDFDNQQN